MATELAVDDDAIENEPAETAAERMLDYAESVDNPDGLTLVCREVTKAQLQYALEFAKRFPFDDAHVQLGTETGGSHEGRWVQGKEFFCDASGYFWFRSGRMGVYASVHMDPFSPEKCGGVTLLCEGEPIASAWFDEERALLIEIEMAIEMTKKYGAWKGG